MDPLVSIPWLADHLRDPNLVVLDATLPPVGVLPAVDVAARYREQHISGAVFFDIEALSDHTTTLPHMLPSVELFAAQMGALGVSNTMTLVVYEQLGVFSAPRAWWMLRTMGAREVRVLDGDLRAWVDAGHPIQAGSVTRSCTTFTAHLDRKAVRSFHELRQALETGSAQVLDARSGGRFSGTAPEPRPGLPSGHMPGALNVPYTELVTEGKLKDVDALKDLFIQHGVDLTQPIITTCGSGVTAAVLALGLNRCAADEVSLYDGSWAEYAAHPEGIII